MGLSSLSIRKHIAVLMLTLAVVVVGVFYVVRLPIDLLPAITYPRIGLRFDVPGVSPEIAVEEITKPLEETLAATEGLQQIFSQTSNGRLSIDLYFAPGGNIDQALNDATAALNRGLGRIPEGLGVPRLFKFDPSQLPVYELALTSPSLDDATLRTFAENELERELSVINGVASVDTSGGVTEEVRVQVDFERLQALGIPLNAVIQALEARNRDIAGGRFSGSDQEALIRTLGRFRSAAELANVAVTVNGQPVFLRDFARILDDTAEQRVFVTLNGTPAVKVSVQKQPGTNTVAVVDRVRQRLDDLERAGILPRDLVMTPTLDESVFIRSSLRNVTSAALSGAALAGLAVFAFLGSLRQTLIVVFAIPLASFTAVILMGVSGLSLNMFSLGGLALGVGIVVDNAIVMLEAMAAAIERLEAPEHKAEVLTAAAQSSQELESALVASTSTNLVAVLPFLLVGGFIALLFNELILTISFAIAASLLVGLTVVPMLTARTLALPFSSGVRQWAPYRRWQRTLAWMTLRYAHSLAWVLQRRLWVVGLAVLILGGSSVILAGRIPQELLPRISTGQANVNVQFPSGTPLAANRETMRRVDAIIDAQPETEYAFTTAGGALFGASTAENTQRGSVSVTLRPGTNVSAFIERLNRELGQLNLIDTRIRVNPGAVRGLILNNSPVRADVDVQLQGDNTEALKEAGRSVLQALDAQATLARYRPDASEPQPEIQILPDWERATALGLSTADIGQTVQAALQGRVATQLERGDRLVDVRLELDDTVLERPSQLAQLPLLTPSGQRARLGDVARVEQGMAPGEIQRINQRQVFLIAGTLNEGANLNEALAEVAMIVDRLDLPAGVSRLPSAAADANRDTQVAFITLGALAAFLVFVVMAVQYNSVIDPLVIILTVPLALAGGIWGLFLTQTPFGITVVVGAVLLVGIVVNNAIILVELANQIRQHDGVDAATAMLKAAPQRLRPILMTTITTVLGLFPLAIANGEGSELLQPMGVVIFSGLSLATLLTLFLIPCFYTLLHPDHRQPNTTPLTVATPVRP